MHKIKIADFKFLLVLIYNDGDELYKNIFYDKDEEASRWMIDQMQNNNGQVPLTKVLKDLNYLLNEMIQNKSTRTGDALFEIYINNYPETDQMKKVIEFWNK